jgi:hypothetical protein
MSIDSRDKRMSMIGFGSPVPRVLPSPTGAFDAAGRAMLLYLYYGISLGEAAEAPSILATIYGPNPNATIYGPNPLAPVEADR